MDPKGFNHGPGVIVLHFTNALTVHQKNLNQIFIINGVLSDRYEGYSKGVVA